METICFEIGVSSFTSWPSAYVKIRHPASAMSKSARVVRYFSRPIPTTSPSVIASPQCEHKKKLPTSFDTPSAPCRAACTFMARATSGSTNSDTFTLSLSASFAFFFALPLSAILRPPSGFDVTSVNSITSGIYPVEPSSFGIDDHRGSPGRVDIDAVVERLRLGKLGLVAFGQLARVGVGLAPKRAQAGREPFGNHEGRAGPGLVGDGDRHLGVISSGPPVGIAPRQEPRAPLRAAFLL